MGWIHIKSDPVDTLSFTHISLIGIGFTYQYQAIFKTIHTVDPEALHSSFDDDYSLLIILCLISFRYLIKILVGVWLQQKSFEANKCRFKSSRVKIASSTRLESSSLDRVWIESAWRQENFGLCLICV